jgi:hypothetical protein
VKESVDKKIEYYDLQAYQGQQQLEVERLKKGFGKPPSTYRENNYIYWCNHFESINKGKLGHSQSWKNKKEKKYEYYG